VKESPKMNANLYSAKFFYVEKISTKIWATFVLLPNGENSPNPVTLNTNFDGCFLKKTA
jgi:hypothetical protein